MSDKPTFKHGFKSLIGLVNIPGAQGYQQALIEVMKHIADKALIKDNILYVNAKELNEILDNTFNELRLLVDEELKGDNLFNNICNIVKKDAKDRYGIEIEFIKQGNWVKGEFIESKMFPQPAANETEDKNIVDALQRMSDLSYAAALNVGLPDFLGKEQRMNKVLEEFPNLKANTVNKELEQELALEKMYIQNEHQLRLSCESALSQRDKRNTELLSMLKEITEMAEKWSVKGLTPTIQKAKEIIKKQ